MFYTHCQLAYFLTHFTIYLRSLYNYWKVFCSVCDFGQNIKLQDNCSCFSYISKLLVEKYRFEYFATPSSFRFCNYFRCLCCFVRLPQSLIWRLHVTSHLILIFKCNAFTIFWKKRNNFMSDTLIIGLKRTAEFL